MTEQGFSRIMIRGNTITKENQFGLDGAGVPSTGSGKALRKRAEDVFREKAAGMAEDVEALSPDEVRQTLHELRVHRNWKPHASVISNCTIWRRSAISL
jgi:hypothetical protein